MRRLIALIEKTGQADKLRHIYHRIAQIKKIVRFEVENQDARFWVPNKESETDIVYFTETEQLHSFLRLLREGDVVWDVGANMGVYSMLAGKIVSTTGRVYCFEPERRLQRILKANRLVNKLGDRVVIVPLALGSTTGKAVLYESAVTMGTHSLVKRFDDYRSKDKAIQIEISRADDLVGQSILPPPNAIKIDVEGAEFDVCEGLKGLMESAPPRVIFLEVHPALLGNFGRSTEDLRSLLTGYGYEIADCGSRGTEYYWMATRNGERVDS
jgi:FkbM family methyltransferase